MLWGLLNVVMNVKKISFAKVDHYVSPKSTFMFLGYFISVVQCAAVNICRGDIRLPPQNGVCCPSSTRAAYKIHLKYYNDHITCKLLYNIPLNIGKFSSIIITCQGYSFPVVSLPPMILFTTSLLLENGIWFAFPQLQWFESYSEMWQNIYNKERN